MTTFDPEMRQPVVIVGAGDSAIGAEISSAGAVHFTHGKTIKSVSGVMTADTDVIAAVATKRIKVMAYQFSTVGQSTNPIIFKSGGTSGTELWRLILEAPATTVFSEALAVPAPSFLFGTVAGEKLTLDVGNTDSVTYAITYFDDDAA